jgi:tryptophan-rich sensory protein
MDVIDAMNETHRPASSKKTELLGLAISLGACFLVAAIGGLVTSTSVNDWYLTLRRPAWNPPAWVFGPVWTALYFLMGVSAWLVWKNVPPNNSRLPLALFGFQLLLNLLWSILFFGLQEVGWAAAEIVLLWLTIALMLVLFMRIDRLAGWLLVPYLLWVGFAGVLNFSLWSLNR